MACVSNVRFHIHLNGWIHCSFMGRRDLRQGDLLSPLLSVLVVEYFSRVTHRFSAHPNFKYHPHYKQLHLTHLMFADDLILFCKVDAPTIHIIKSALTVFSQCAGLEANLQKSQLVLGGCSPMLHTQCLRAACYRKATFL